MERFIINSEPLYRGDEYQLCVDTDGIPNGTTITVEVNYDPSGGSITVEFVVPTNVCKTLVVPDDANGVTFHDVSNPQWSEDRSATIFG